MPHSKCGSYPNNKSTDAHESKKAYIKLSDSLPKQEEIVLLEKKAKLLQSYGYLINEGDYELKLPPEYTGENSEILIEIDPDKNLGSNLDILFIKLKKSQRSLTMGQEQILKLEKSIKAIESDLSLLSSSSVDSLYLNDLCKKYKLPIIKISTKTKETISLPYKTYISSTGHEILVGKGPKENDELTKSARSNDYWFHAAGVSGSHVVVPIKSDIRDSIPSELVKQAAILAIHFSKFKGDFSGESYLAKKSQIKKRKGMPAGLWNVERCETIYIKYTKEELQNILSSIKI